MWAFFREKIARLFYLFFLIFFFPFVFESFSLIFVLVENCDFQALWCFFFSIFSDALKIWYIFGASSLINDTKWLNALTKVQDE